MAVGDRARELFQHTLLAAEANHSIAPDPAVSVFAVFRHHRVSRAVEPR